MYICILYVDILSNKSIYPSSGICRFSIIASKSYLTDVTSLDASLKKRTYIWGTDVCDVEIGHGFEDWTSIRAWTSIWVYIYTEPILYIPNSNLYIYRLIHGLFILPLLSARDLDIGPEDFSPRDDISRGLMTSAIWKSPCINIFIAYFSRADNMLLPFTRGQIIQLWTFYEVHI